MYERLRPSSRCVALKTSAWGSRPAADPTPLHRRFVGISLDTLRLLPVKIWRSKGPRRSIRTSLTFPPTFAPSWTLRMLLG